MENDSSLYEFTRSQIPLGDIANGLMNKMIILARNIAREAAEYEEKYSDDQPRVPAGSPNGGQWTSEGGNASTESWGNPNTLQEHFENHGADFGATSPEDYANKANEFLTRAQNENLPMVEGGDGVIRAYDPETNAFGSYNPDGTTKTFFKPPEGAEYFQRQIDYDLSTGGKVINPLIDDTIIPTEIPDTFIPE